MERKPEKEFKPKRGDIVLFVSYTHGVTIAKYIKQLPDGEHAGTSLWANINVFAYEVRPLGYIEAIKEQYSGS